ncbi:MAG TPA: DUF1080 domain-containing protein [Bryobacteraceae bacterium]|nr:DUF1080 domain-containing protein [Bryobacteraceae bacterium]
MKHTGLALVIGGILLIPARSQTESTPFLGRWDITVKTPNSSYPGWLEVVQQNGALQGRYQPRGGSVHPVEMKLEGSRLNVVLSASSTTHPNATSWDLAIEGNGLAGVEKHGDTVAAQIAGVRAPELKRAAPKSWMKPEAIFNGKDLTGWEPSNPATNHWVAEDGVLLNQSKGANLRTTRKFDDFKLHIEFNCPQDGNSGIYLRGRYEVQVEYEPLDANDKYHSIGSIYGFIAPSVDLPRTPGQWETFDITLVGRTLTVMRNGKTTIDHQEIPGITGGALDSNESEPGPFYLQGDHTGGMKYRNITVSLPAR